MGNELAFKQTTISSIEVADMLGIRHADILRKIDNYYSTLLNAKLRSVEYFIEDAYKDNSGKENKCYQLTKIGCDFIANKFTGEKGIIFTAKYVKKFNEMEKYIKEDKKIEKPTDDKAKLAEAKLMNAKVRVSNQLLKLINVDTLSKEYKNILVSKATEVLTGEQLLPLPQSKQKTYSATELGEMFGVSANRIGRVSNVNNLKTEQYGEYYRDKSQNSEKEVDSFRYYDSVIPEFKRIFKADKSLSLV